MSGAREKLVVIVPCFNEEGNIRQTIASIREVAVRLPLDVDVLMIDDGSTDGTRAAIEALCQEFGYRAIYNPKNRGVGRSLVDAYVHIEPGTWVTIVPGDNEADFASIESFVEMRGSYDIILGYLHNPIIRPLGRRILSTSYTRVVRALFGLPYRYLNGMKLFRVDVFQGIEVQASGHAFNAELLSKAILRNPRLRIGEAPYLARGRARGTSKAIRPRAIVQAIREVATGLTLVARYRDDVIRGDGRDS